MTHKEFIDLWMDDAVESVWKDLDDSYRHGNYVTEVYKDQQGRFWRVAYTESGDGEQHGIRDNEMYLLEEVEQYQVQLLLTKYRTLVE
jgi:hypothetical protein